MTPPRLTWPCPPFNTVNNGFYGPPSVAGQIHHNAVDFPAPSDTRLLQPIVGGGLVTEVGAWGAGGYADTGNMIEVSADGFSVRMLHLRQSLVRVGQRVAEGEHIGYTDNTGKTTGPHLHMAVWADTKGLALQVQSDPVQVYGRWAVDPEILLALPEEDDMVLVVARPSGRCFTVDAVGKHYISSIAELGFWIAEVGDPKEYPDGTVDQIRGN